MSIKFSRAMIPIPAFLAYSAYELVSIPLYLRIIYVLFMRKEFKHPFFRILFVIGVLEICHYSIDVMFYRLPMFGPTVDWFDKSPSRWLGLVSFLIYFLNYPIYVLHIALTLNRFTTVWTPMARGIWKEFWLPIVCFAFFVSFCFTAHRILAVSQMVLFVANDPDKGYIPFPIKTQFYNLDTSLLTAVFNTFVFLFCTFINALTIFKIVQLKKANKIMNEAQRSEFNLYILSVWMTVTLSVLIAFQMSLFLLKLGATEPGYAYYVVFLQQPLVEILGTESHPWVLIVISTAIRNAALPFLRNKFGNKKNKGVQQKVIFVVPKPAASVPNF